MLCQKPIASSNGSRSDPRDAAPVRTNLRTRVELQAQTTRSIDELVAAVYVRKRAGMECGLGSLSMGAVEVELDSP